MDILSAQKELCQKNIYFITNKEPVFAAYCSDAFSDNKIPLFVVIPESERELIEAVRTLLFYKVPVTARGSGTGTSGGGTAEGSALLVLTKLCKIIIHPLDFIAEVEPGAVTGDIKKESEKHSLFYPPDPASYNFSTIGGNIAANAGGPTSVLYGSTRDFVKKIRMIDGNGEILEFGAPLHKYSTAYFLPSFFCGSEGTLGILLKAWLKLIPNPSFEWFYEVENPNYHDFHELRLLRPANLEYLDRCSGELVRGEKISFLLIKIDADDATMLEYKKDRLSIFLKSKNYQFREGNDKSVIWSAREELSPLSYKIAPFKISQDIVLPLSKIGEFARWLEIISNKYKELSLVIFAFGHIGDGNLHVNIMHNENNKKEALDAQKIIISHCASLGGMLSGEHGVGSSRKEFLSQFIGKKELEIMRSIKSVFDPENLMNPGKLFDV